MLERVGYLEGVWFYRRIYLHLSYSFCFYRKLQSVFEAPGNFYKHTEKGVVLWNNQSACSLACFTEKYTEDGWQKNTRWKLALVFLSLCKHFHAVASYFD